MEWSGGSKTEYAPASIATAQRRGWTDADNYQSPPGWPNSGTGGADILPGSIVIESGYFSGKPSTPVIHVRPDEL